MSRELKKRVLTSLSPHHTAFTVLPLARYGLLWSTLVFKAAGVVYRCGVDDQ